MSHRSRFWLPALSLAWRELIRFYRQGNRVVGALATPLLFWLMLGFGFRSSFRLPGYEQMNALEFLYPGSIVLNILFTAIFSSISLIQDRNEGFLQAVLVAPLKRSGLAMGKILGGATLAASQGMLFLVLAPFVGVKLTFLSFILSAIIIILISFALTGVGFICAWRMQSVQGFHAVMNLFLMPMWVLSSSFFPAVGAPVVLRTIMMVNPLTYGVIALRHAFYLSDPRHFYEPPGFWISFLVMAGFAAVVFLISTRMAARVTKGDLQ